MKKRLAAALLAAVICAGLLPVSASAAQGVSVTNILGGPAVVIDMTGRTGDVSLAGGSVVKDENVRRMVPSNSYASINGGFCSYYSGAGDSFPNNCPSIYGAVVKDGQLINAAGDNNVIAFTDSGRVIIDRVHIKVQVTVGGKGPFTPWGVNKMFTQDGAIMLMTSMLTLPFTAPEGSMVFTARNGKVTAIGGPGSYVVPEDGVMLVFNRDAVANAKQWELLPVVGDEVTTENVYTPTRIEETALWSKVTTLVSGGRMLVQDGRDVTADTYYNASLDGQSKQDNQSVLTRSYAALKEDGTLILGNASTDFPSLAKELIRRGAKYALSLDGGASSMLYANGGFLGMAGRKLPLILNIIPTDPNAYVEPPEPVSTGISPDPNGGTAYASTQKVDVDGRMVEFEMYALHDDAGGETNYIKLRDLAHVLNYSDAQFAVGYDGSVMINTGISYSANGSEMSTPYSGDRRYRINTAPVKINGRQKAVDAFVLTDDNGGDYTYFKLRDLGLLIGFNVDYDATTQTVLIQSDIPYQG